MRAILLATCALGLVAPGVAAAADDDGTVAELVVTAQKREEKLIEVPLSVQSLSGEAVERSGAAKVSDLTKLIPGASVVSSTTPGFETIQIRGVSSGTTGDGLVGYYIDDTPFGVPNLQLTPPARLLDLERVEVIRGPSGTLYGQGSMGGTIKLITAKPDPNNFSGKAQAEISATEGGGTNYNADGVVNMPLIKGQLAARLSAGYERLSGYAEAPELQRRNVNDFTGKNARLTLGWEPTDDVRLTGFVWIIRNDQDFSNSLTPKNATTSALAPTPFNLPGIVGTGGRLGYTDVDADIYSATLNWSTSIGDLTVNTSYVDHELDFITPLLTILVNESNFHTKSYTNEVRLSSKADSPVRWIVGGYTRNAKIRSDIFYYSQATRTAAKTGIINTLGTIDTDSYSVFGEVSAKFFGGLVEPLFGLSYFKDDRSVDGVDRATGAPRVGQLKFDSFNPRFNLKIKPAENGTVYLNVAKGFRSGALQTPAQANAANVTLGLPAGTIQTSVQPDKLWTYELGTRWEMADGQLLVEGSVYRTDWDNVLVQFATAAVISLANGGDAKIEGADFGMAYRPDGVSGLTLAATGNIQNARFKRVVGNLSVGTAIRKGGRVPNVPEMSFTVSADYKRELSALGGLTGTAYLGYSFRDDVIDATVKNLKAGELNDLTVRLGVQKDNWRLEGFMLNGLDDKDPVALGSTAVQILYPRRYGVQLAVNF
ncbi:MAG: TonB-dependent receptor [Phenylobacterium sp.]|uniref:TonB-dependent receptor n=1 Tax=Phenylobacterium sp. TaxID=1871053 RepID=UPI001A58D32F|nr:TonB-dependent receptor [Phenylobacterium sp.]MBL8553749.1 TonB-dependent receptor [Phenylobacterium sp.]